MDEITKEGIAQYLEQLQSEINKASATNVKELYQLDCDAWRRKDFEQFFSVFPPTKYFTDIVRKLFSASDGRYGMPYSDVEYLQGLVNQDTVLMLLEEIVTSAFEGEKTLVKRLDKQCLCKNVQTEEVFHAFCDLFKCNDKKRDIILFQLSEVDIIKEALPIYLFFAYLQIAKHSKEAKSGKFIDGNIIKMQTLEAGYLQSGVRFMDFIYGQREKINYPLNLYLLNRYLLVPDTIFFSEYPKSFLEQVNEALKEEKGITTNFVDLENEEAILKHEADWQKNLSFTTLKPMLCKWYLFTLWQNSDCNLFEMNGGFKALNHILSCVESKIFAEWKKQDSQTFCSLYKQLCSLSRKCNIPFSSAFSDALDESHERCYNAVREYYKVYRTTDTTFPTDSK